MYGGSAEDAFTKIQLADKLQVVVKSASSFLVGSRAKRHGPGSSEDMGRHVEIFKLLLALSKEIESLIQGCCKDGWIQAAMTLTNVSEYISSMGFNLELCRVAFCMEYAASESLTLDQVADLYKDEVVKIVKKKASTDVDALLAKVTYASTKKSLSNEENDLAIYLLQKLQRVKPIPLSVASWWSFTNGWTVLGNLFEWVKPLERLEKGALGIVYRAIWLGILVAKKTFHGQNNLDFKKDVEILARLYHPNVTSMFCCVE